MYVLFTYISTLFSCIYCHRHVLFVDFLINLPKIQSDIVGMKD